MGLAPHSPPAPSSAPVPLDSDPGPRLHLPPWLIHPFLGTLKTRVSQRIGIEHLLHARQLWELVQQMSTARGRKALTRAGCCRARGRAHPGQVPSLGKLNPVREDRMASEGRGGAVGGSGEPLGRGGI